MHNEEAAAENAGLAVPIRLARMPQQAKALTDSEDWTGITCPVERRKLQNRLNQRARRLRQGVKPRKSRKVAASADAINDSQDAAAAGSPKTVPTTSDEVLVARFLAQEKPWLPRTRPELCDLSADQIVWLASQLEYFASRTTTRMLLSGGAATSGSSPQSELLLTLTKFNMFRAMAVNCEILGIRHAEFMEDDIISEFFLRSSSRGRSITDSPEALSTGNDSRSSSSSLSPSVSDGSTPPTEYDGDGEEVDEEYTHLPQSMRPTRLQRQVPHHPWIDAIPVPGLRDNILRAGSRFELVEDEFCNDVADFSGDSPGGTSGGIVIWGEAWDPKGWELTESFVLRWGWTVRGCKEIYESTNYWRAKRGEKPFPYVTS